MCMYPRQWGCFIKLGDTAIDREMACGMSHILGIEACGMSAILTAAGIEADEEEELEEKGDAADAQVV